MAPEPASPSVGPKPAVLVVDDEYGPRESVAFTLSGEFDVDTAERAAEALGKIKAKAYAAIVMDIRMPEMDGIRALEELRKIDADVAVIMLTGYGTLHTAQQAMVGGANQYLRKPPDVSELREAVRRQTAQTRLRRQQTKLNREAQELNRALKREIEQNEPQIWQSRAAVELVHDLNNPLTVVIGYSSLMAEEAVAISQTNQESGQRLREYAHVVEKAAEYCRHLSENWRRASKNLAEFAPLDLVQLTHEVRHVVFFSSVAIKIEADAEAWVRGSRYDVVRVLQNLFQNSLDAGATTINATVKTAGGRVEMAIVDNGAGMDEKSVARALRGGFSTKDNGTGLGLGICRHLLGAHGAEFQLTSRPGAGTTVRISFPVLHRE
ncbi:hybrid sensor histidine kinase/response regulator [Horticoccus luteus]|uniref:histidine kinase n=1 Tax=Horticoccus luteus TaxID=2862869 RepID=A0A8F9XK58_9BACT|nr:hybrid sensor histidine kinase/response regulator [Horticoccus luteus]QYM77861.1 hybrid sensor histidine kinase/response regulator [Horticoccus luteus]